MSVDPYEALGVQRDAGVDEIKAAYRRLARQLHPDANPGDPAAEARFKEVAVAYEILSNPERRRQYDMFGMAGTGAGGAGGSPFGPGGGGLGDLFEMFFGGGSPFGGQSSGSRSNRGADMEVAIELAFEEAVFGVQAPVTVRVPVACEDCEATGAAPGTQASTCPDCGGVGQVRRVRQSILGQMVTAGPCPRCGGMGSVVATPCPTCRGEGRRTQQQKLTVDVPAGVDNGATLRLAGRGAAGPRGAGSGDLYVHLRVRPHEQFERHGNDLVFELHLPVTQAALGAELELKTLDGVEVLKVPKGVQTGHVFRIRDRGVPNLGGRGRGALLVQVVVDTPADVSPEEDALLRELAELRGEEVAPPEAGFISRVRSAFK